jgi:hypothetical protein
MARDLDARHDLDPAAVIVSACLRLGSGLPLRRGGGRLGYRRRLDFRPGVGFASVWIEWRERKRDRARRQDCAGCEGHTRPAQSLSASARRVRPAAEGRVEFVDHRDAKALG